MLATMRSWSTFLSPKPSFPAIGKSKLGSCRGVGHPVGQNWGWQEQAMPRLSSPPSAGWLFGCSLASGLRNSSSPEPLLLSRLRHWKSLCTPASIPLPGPEEAQPCGSWYCQLREGTALICSQKEGTDCS